MEKKSVLLFVGHLDEIDDLNKWERDAPLLDSKKNRIELVKISSEISTRIKETGKKVVMFIMSPRIRSIETAHLAAEMVKNLIETKLKFRFVVEQNLKATEQGKFVLPKEYNAGCYFEGLNIASNIFIKESFDLFNHHYRFGDPVVRPDGSYQYPELVQYFIASGETNSESLIRIFNSVIKMSQKVKKLNNSVEIVIVAHGFTYRILKGLVVISERIKQGNIEIKTGELAAKLWEIFLNDKTKLNMFEYLDYSNLKNRSLINFLIKEIKYLTK